MRTLIVTMSVGVMLSACSAAPTSRCASPTSVTTAGQSAEGLGGYVVFDVEERKLQGPLAPGTTSTETVRSNRLCTAVFDFQGDVVEGRKPVHVWTAAHCTGESLDNVTALRLLVFSGGAYVEIPVTFEFLERRRAAAEFFEKEAMTDESWRTAFFWRLPLDSGPSDNLPCRNGYSGAPVVWGADEQSVCASWSDLLSLDVSLPEAEFARIRGSLFPDGAPLSLERDSEFMTRHDGLVRMRREISVAESVDSYFVCKATPLAVKTDPANTMDCTLAQEQVLEAVLHRFALPDGRDALVEAAAAGVTGAETKYGDMMKWAFSQELSKLRAQWRGMGAGIVSGPKGLALFSNTVPEASFSRLLFTDLGASPTTVTIEDFGLRVSQKRSTASVFFSKGDSGTIFALGGRAPVLALQSLNNEETSGGAALARLPKRSASSGPSPSTSNAGKRDSTGQPCVVKN